ncbi:hypothetical protein ACFCX0_34380 [Streptomyces sp. NPDC056352]|uniref:hypothetical protein n=1 Tax=Streptomyces sp. NPDC056352 TaxID=3345791 RepID=UPI0035E2ECA3
MAARRYFAQNNVEFYAALLARHSRIEELRELGTGEHAVVGHALTVFGGRSIAAT